MVPVASNAIEMYKKIMLENKFPSNIPIIYNNVAQMMGCLVIIRLSEVHRLRLGWGR